MKQWPKKKNDKPGCFSPYASLSPFRASEEINVALLRHVLADLYIRSPASSLNESMASNIASSTTFGTDGPITDTIPVRVDNFWQPKMAPRTGFGPGPNFS